MKIIKDHRHIYVDVDNTLVNWDIDPLHAVLTIPDPADGTNYHLDPNINVINQLKDFKGRGFCVHVWSAAGWEWAETVVKELKLQDYVDYVQTKPECYIDDLPVKNWMGKNYHPKIVTSTKVESLLKEREVMNQRLIQYRNFCKQHNIKTSEEGRISTKGVF